MISSECNGCEYQCKLSHIDICTLGSPCPHQRSTPMTNEEYLRLLNTEQLAETLTDFSFWLVPTIPTEDKREQIRKKIVEWLKEIHDEM